MREGGREGGREGEGRATTEDAEGGMGGLLLLRLLLLLLLLQREDEETVLPTQDQDGRTIAVRGVNVIYVRSLPFLPPSLPPSLLPICAYVWQITTLPPSLPPFSPLHACRSSTP
jgi:hypothetical protein